MNGRSKRWVVISRNVDFSREVAKFGSNLYSVFDLYPNGFSHKEFAENVGVVYIPYNISTMRLFELATAGFQIRIPTNRLLREWIDIPGVLSELSWVQVIDSDCPKWMRNTPADPGWIEFYEWWLARADWHNKEYFPNVRLFDSVEELVSEPIFDFDITDRNLMISQSWQNVTDNFFKEL
jgi:hypothetical protein